MQAYTTPVLTDRVPYDWQQLKQAARASVPEEQPASNTLSKAFEKELVDALIPLILERIHAQVSIMVDMTMKSAASKIRADFDKALDKTVRSAVEQVVRERIAQ